MFLTEVCDQVGSVHLSWYLRSHLYPSRQLHRNFLALKNIKENLSYKFGLGTEGFNARSRLFFIHSILPGLLLADDVQEVEESKSVDFSASSWCTRSFIFCIET
jgi:hypothetical protein